MKNIVDEAMAELDRRTNGTLIQKHKDDVRWLIVWVATNTYMNPPQRDNVLKEFAAAATDAYLNHLNDLRTESNAARHPF